MIDTNPMVQQPYEVLGSVTRSEGHLAIDLDPRLDVIKNASLVHGQVVRMLLWPNAGPGMNASYADLETIAEVQQLDRLVVGQGLESEGALWLEGNEFLKRLALVEQ